MKVLVTGMAGFIGYHLSKALAERGDEVVGIDTVNDYYNPRYKWERLAGLGVPQCEEWGVEVKSTCYPALTFIRMDIADRERVDRLVREGQFDAVVNLAAQAGVRYSLENPHAYVQANVVGFVNLLESCRLARVKHLVYASSSSVYGTNEKVPYAETDRVDEPASLYAATKRADELMAQVYSKLYKLPVTGLRFFTVYGPYGRPDMAPFLFMDAVRKGLPIRVFNQGNMLRDFTYIDDIIRGVLLVIDRAPEGEVPSQLYNIGNSQPVRLLDFIATIERAVGRKAICRFEAMQPGDVPCTYADITKLERDFGFRPDTSLADGIARFHVWFMQSVPRIEAE